MNGHFTMPPTILSPSRIEHANTRRIMVDLDGTETLHTNSNESLNSKEDEKNSTSKSKTKKKKKRRRRRRGKGCCK